MPAGFRAAISAAGVSGRMSSEKTPASRTRRAMSWAVWLPKSRIRTVWRWSWCVVAWLIARPCARACFGAGTLCAEGESLARMAVGGGEDWCYRVGVCSCHLTGGGGVATVQRG